MLGAVMDKRSILQLVMAATHNMETAASQVCCVLQQYDAELATAGLLVHLHTSGIASLWHPNVCEAGMSWPMILFVSASQEVPIVCTMQ